MLRKKEETQLLNGSEIRYQSAMISGKSHTQIKKLLRKNIKNSFDKFIFRDGYAVRYSAEKSGIPYLELAIDQIRKDTENEINEFVIIDEHKRATFVRNFVPIRDLKLFQIPDNIRLFSDSKLKENLEESGDLSHLQEISIEDFSIDEEWKKKKLIVKSKALSIKKYGFAASLFVLPVMIMTAFDGNHEEELARIKKAETKKLEVVDVHEKYKADISKRVKASSVIEAANTLIPTLELVDDGWIVSQVNQSGNKLIASIKKGNGSIAYMDSFLEAVNTPKIITSRDGFTANIITKIEAGEDFWTQNIAGVVQSTSSVIDNLENLGFKIEHKGIQKKEGYSESKLVAKIKAPSQSTLKIASKLLSAYPAYTNKIAINNPTGESSQIMMTINILGGNHS